MAKKRKKQVIEELKAIGIEFNPKAKYKDLCELLRTVSSAPSSLPEPTISKERAEKRGDTPVCRKGNQITIVNKIPKRNTFLADSVRDERDAEKLRAEIGKREHKGKIKRITTVKEMEVSKDGFWVTEFVIDLKG